jgi:hypothetical protein
MANKKLIEFIKEARKRGFDDIQIKIPLLKKGWPHSEIDNAFASLSSGSSKYKFKNKITIFLDNRALKILEKRAKKNLLTISEQIEDILRRSCIKTKLTSTTPEKLDDLLVSIFSRKK